MWFFGKRKQGPAAEPAVDAHPEPRPAADEAGAPAGSVLDNLADCVVRIGQGRFDRAAIDPRAHLFDAGYIDSLSSAELLSHIERRYQLRLPEVQLVGRLCTLEALAREIEAQIGPAR